MQTVLLALVRLVRLYLIKEMVVMSIVLLVTQTIICQEVVVIVVLFVVLEKEKRLLVRHRQGVCALKMYVHVPMVLLLQELLVLHMIRSCAHRAILDILVLCAP